MIPREVSSFFKIILQKCMCLSISRVSDSVTDTNMTDINLLIFLKPGYEQYVM